MWIAAKAYVIARVPAMRRARRRSPDLAETADRRSSETEHLIREPFGRQGCGVGEAVIFCRLTLRVE